MSSTSSEEVAWAAGLFEGEGCFTIQRTTRIRKDKSVAVYKQPVARLYMTDKDVVKTFFDVVSVGIFWEAGYRRGGLGIKPAFEWHVVTAPEYLQVYNLLSPWLGERRRLRGLEVLEEYRQCQRNLGRVPKA